MNALRLSISIVALAAIAVLGASCAKEPKTIAIGINSWPGYEFLYLAKQKGFYQKRGLDVKIVQFNSLADARHAYERGQLDGLACTMIEHCQILDKTDRSPKIVFVADYSNGGDVVLANDIANISELKGAKIGLEIESLGVFILARMLATAGLSLDDVEPIRTDQLSIPQQLCSGEIDAAITYPPHSIEAQNNCDASQIFSSAEIPLEILDILVFEADIIESSPDSVRAVVEALYEAQEWSTTNTDEAYSIMANREGISVEEFATILNEDIHIVTRNEQAPYFEKDGILDKTLRHVDSVLRQTNQLVNSPRFADSVARELN